eukprot:12925565-Prorocentrum_lima.AAC.1
MHEQSRAVIVYCRDHYCHAHHLVNQLCANGGILLSCNLGLKHHQNNRSIKLKKRIVQQQYCIDLIDVNAEQNQYNTI